MSIGRLMLDLEGITLSSEETVLLASEQVGGVILFSRNFQSAEQVERLIQEMRRINPHLLIAVDHEGGRVWRFRSDYTRLPPMRHFGELFIHEPHIALQSARSAGWIMAAELLASGLDFSFAPVLDLDWGYSQVIGDRAFSNQPNVVAELATALVIGMREAGMSATGKHFPGHGYVEADSHTDIPKEHRDLDAILKADVEPFAQLIRQGLEAIMPAHVIYSRVDPNPAGFSSFWLQQVLKDQLGFEGIIFSDDLTMEGATVAGSFESRAEVALAAGCDMVLVCNHRQGAKAVLDWMVSRQVSPCDKLRTMCGRWNHEFTGEGTKLAQLQNTPEWRAKMQNVNALLTLKS